ncbi:MAG: DsbA family protein [Gemmatimonadaceae bacterium]
MSEQRRSNRPFVIALGIVAIVGVLALAWTVTRPKAGVTDVDIKGDPSQARGYVMGDTTAPVQVIEFADFECPACATFATLTEPDIRKGLIQTGKVGWRYLDFPLPMHRNTWFASNAAACADEQGKFWQMHDTLFANQDRWNGEATGSPKGIFKGYAQSVGLDVPKWEACYDADRYHSRIASNRAEAERRHVGSTPTFIIGGKMVPGALSYDEFAKYVNDATAAAGGAARTGAAAASGAPPGTVPPATVSPNAGPVVGKKP